MTMTGLETIGITAAAKGLTDLVVKPISEVLNKRLDEPFKQLIFNAFGKYIQNYNERHGILKVLGMREFVKLENVYTSVQFLGRSDLWRFDPSKLEKDYRQTERRRLQAERNKRQDGLIVANDKQYLMVLGQPGAGKSTFLRRIGLEALKGKNGGYRQECVPVFLELKQFRTGEVDLEKAIADEFAICGFPYPLPTTQKLLEKGKLLILLDGLDEVPTQQLDQAITQIQNFADKYKQNRFIASCRTAAYQSSFRKFADVIMADFDEGQIEKFIINWFQSEQDKQAKTAQSCWELLKQPTNTATKELAQTPLLLTLLCLVFDDSQTFPEKRAELYKQALDVLLSKWAAEKRIQHDPIYKDLTLTLETIMLGEIAYSGFKADRLFFSQREVVDQIRAFLASNLNAPRHLDGEVILRAIQIQQGVLVERARDVFSFSHLTLQEYLTAQYIADNERVDNKLVEQLVHNHLTDQRWREVFQLVAGLMRGGGDPLLLLIERCSQKFITSQKIQALINWADQETKNSDGNFKPAAKRAFLILLVLARARALFRGHNHEITSAFALAYECISDLLHDIDSGFPRSLAFELSFTRDLTRVLSLTQSFEDTKIFNTVNFSNLISKLNSLSTRIPDNSQSSEVRQTFADQIFSIWHDALNLKTEWIDLSKSEINALNDYLYANTLMVRCKEAAVRVSPQVWAEIESRILTVPEQ
jgi:NACHT domain